MQQYHEAVDVAAAEARLKAYFEDDPCGAVAVYLFGCVARGLARPTSDVNVGVLFAVEPPATLDAPQFALEGDLERLLGRSVQVVALNRASADVVHRVLRDGRLILDRDRSARIRFEVRSRNEYFDMEPIRRMYRRHPPAPSAGTDGVTERQR